MIRQAHAMRPVCPQLPTPPPLPPNASPSRRWRFRRDLVIYLANRRLGLSQRFLSDVFDLPRSRIAAIVEKFAAHDQEADAN